MAIKIKKTLKIFLRNESEDFWLNNICLIAHLLITHTKIYAEKFMLAMAKKFKKLVVITGLIVFSYLTLLTLLVHPQNLSGSKLLVPLTKQEKLAKALKQTPIVYSSDEIYRDWQPILKTFTFFRAVKTYLKEMYLVELQKETHQQSERLEHVEYMNLYELDQLSFSMEEKSRLKFLNENYQKNLEDYLSQVNDLVYSTQSVWK